MSARNDVALRCTNIKVRFGEQIVLNGIDLDVLSGSIHALIGPNGAGKTTLANTITGHVSRYSGTIEFHQYRLSGTAWRRARRGIGRKFQVPRTFDRLSALDNIEVAARATSHRRRPYEHEPFDAGFAASMSHGQRQRLELDMVLTRRPSLVVLDEPTAGLTKSERAHLAETLRCQQTECRTTYLIVEHDLDFVASIADNVSYLEAGKIVLSGSYDDIRANPQVRSTYLGKYA